MNIHTIIENLGGTVATAKLCKIRPESVSGWKQRNRIPPAREMYLRVIRPDAFKAKR